MKKLLLILLAIILFNCNNDSQSQRLKSFINNEAKLTQQFFVAPDSVITVIGKKGTKITFKTEDLKSLLNGAEIKDSLLVNLIELTSKQDLLLANTQTISNGKWLISGGAFKIEFLANGERLSLKEGKSISIYFPKTNDEENMEIFHGEIDTNGNMNWVETKTKINEKKYITIHYENSVQLDSNLTRINDVDIYDEELMKKNLGLLSFSEYKNLYPEIDSLYIANDTLSNLKSWKNYEEFLANRPQSELINQSFYDEISTSKLGWINIDKFAANEEKINIKFSFNKSINTTQTYIIDEKYNTILNVYNEEIQIPLNRSFLIISFGINNDTFYGYKKSIRYNKNVTHLINYKKIKKSQLKSLLKL